MICISFNFCHSGETTCFGTEYVMPLWRFNCWRLAKTFLFCENLLCQALARNICRGAITGKSSSGLQWFIFAGFNWFRKFIPPESFSIESCKTNIKVITMTNRKRGNTHANQLEFRVKPSKLPKVWENVGDWVVIGFYRYLVSDWLREWPKCSGLITQWNKAKLLQSCITLDTQLKMALS